jgi:hypothetical protein
MPGLGDYEKKKKGKRGFKMSGPSLYKDSPLFQKKSENRIYVSDTNKVNTLVSEDELESKFKKTGDDPKDYPQYSVQDYSKVKVDKEGRKYVTPRVD